MTYLQANRLTSKFQEHDLISQMGTKQRNRRFVYHAYLALFS
jgi:hypothetical protein